MKIVPLSQFLRILCVLQEILCEEVLLMLISDSFHVFFQGRPDLAVGKILRLTLVPDHEWLESLTILVCCQGSVNSFQFLRKKCISYGWQDETLVDMLMRADCDYIEPTRSFLTIFHVLRLCLQCRNTCNLTWLLDESMNLSRKKSFTFCEG